MAEGKKSFILYCDWWDWIECLTQEQKAQWVDWLFAYVRDLKPDMPKDQALMMVCKYTKSQLKEDLVKYENKVKSIENARKSNRNHIENKLKSNCNQLENDSVNDNDNVNDNVNDNDNVIYGNKLPVYNTHEEEAHIQNLQQLIELVEINIYNKPISNADTKILKNICNEFSFDSVYRDLENYKKDGIKQPIPYYKKALENAEIQEKIFKKENDGGNNNTPPTIKTYEFNDYMSAFKVFTDEDAPQHIRDKAKEFMDGKRGN